MPTGAIPLTKPMTNHSTITLGLALFAVLTTVDAVAADPQPTKVVFLRDVAPILLR